MTQYEMTDALAKKCHVTPEDARTALEVGDWNMLTAAQLLEDETLRRKQALDAVASDCEAMAVQTTDAAAQAAVEAALPAGETKGIEGPGATADAPRARRGHRGGRGLGGHILRLLALGNRNRFEVRRGDEVKLDLPVTALALLMLGSFGTCAFLMVIGLFAGCRYCFSGPELGVVGAANAVKRVKETAAEA